MATSGSTTFTSTLEDIIKDALLVLNVSNPDESVAPQDGALATRVLNRMIKAWQAQGIHLWKKSTATVFLQKDQLEYEIYSTGDHATESYIETTLGADKATGQTTITVTSSTGMTAADYIGIEQDDNTIHWSTIDTVSDSTTVIIDDALTDDASFGLKVYAYTTRVSEPFNIYSMVRESESAIDTPMNYLSYEEYFQLPNKTSSGVPVSYNYDRQLGKSLLKVWPVPDNVNDLVKITYEQKIEDFVSNPNTPDFPQEWHDALVLNLAAKLAHPFGRDNPGGSYVTLKQDAQEALILAMSFDNEQGSLYFQPDFYN